MSALRANGHVNAPFYPLGMVWDESLFVQEREQVRLTTETSLMRQAVSSILSKDGYKQYRETMNKLSVEAVPVAIPGEGDLEGADEWQTEAET